MAGKFEASAKHAVESGSKDAGDASLFEQTSTDKGNVRFASVVDLSAEG